MYYIEQWDFVNSVWCAEDRAYPMRSNAYMELRARGREWRKYRRVRVKWSHVA